MSRLNFELQCFTTRRRSVLKEWFLFFYMILLRDFGCPVWNSRSVTETGVIVRLYDSFRYDIFKWYHVNPPEGTGVNHALERKSPRYHVSTPLTLVAQFLCKELLVAVRYRKLLRSIVKPFPCTFFRHAPIDALLYHVWFQLSLSFSDSEGKNSIHPWHSPEDFTCIATTWMVFL